MLISRNAYRDVTRKNLLGKGREGSTEDTAGYPFSLVLLSIEGLFILSFCNYSISKKKGMKK